MTARLRAQKVFREIGLPPIADAERAPSAANEVWVCGNQVLRINPVQGSRRLHREALLAPHLPPEVGYPTVLGNGVTASGEWLLVERVPGIVLSRAWPDMREPQRRSAVQELAERLKLIHATVPPPGIEEDIFDIYPVEPTRLLLLIARARELPHVDPRVLDDATAFVTSAARYVDPQSKWVLVHGDLHFENVLWADGRLSAVLDFEFARMAPRDLDLATLLRFCADPQLHVADDYGAVTREQDYRKVPMWVGEVYPELFGARNLRERLALYDLAFDLWQLLLRPPHVPVDQLPERHAYNRIRRTVEGRGILATVDL